MARRQSGGRPAKWIVLPDLQIPFVDRRALAAVEAYMADTRFDGWLQLGDLVDFMEISSHEEKNLRMDKVGAIQKSYDAAGEFLDRHAAILRANNRKARMVVLEGNHDFRVEKFLEKNPQCIGMLEVPIALEFKRRRIEWVPFWSKGTIFRLGKAQFIHGRYTVKYHASKHLDMYGDNIFYGHMHSIQVHAKKNIGKDKTVEAACLGCLCRHDLHYMHGGPSDWQLSFSVFHIWPDGYFQRDTTRIFKSRFLADGKVYQG